jgi:hypothetical protein
MAITAEVSLLSLIEPGSSIKAALGAVSGVAVLVTHSGEEPDALAATQPAGNAGATTLSKFSTGVPEVVLMTETDAEAERVQPPVHEMDAVFTYVAPHDGPLVPLMIWT